MESEQGRQNTSRKLPNLLTALTVTPFPWTDVVIIGALVVLNGLFSMAELAIVSARPARLKMRAEAGSASAQLALDLASDQGKLLSTAQIGITLVAVISGAFSGSSLGGPVGERLAALGLGAKIARKPVLPSSSPLPPISAWSSANLCPNNWRCARPNRSP